MVMEREQERGTELGEEGLLEDVGRKAAGLNDESFSRYLIFLDGLIARQAEQVQCQDFPA